MKQLTLLYVCRKTPKSDYFVTVQKTAIIVLWFVEKIRNKMIL